MAQPAAAAVAETVHPVPPPPRPPRPLKVPGYLFTAHTTAEAEQWLEQLVFHTGDRSIAHSVRHNQPVFLLDSQAGQLHGVFRRSDDPQQLQQDLTQPGDPKAGGYQVHVQPLYVFPAPLSLFSVADVLIEQQTNGSTGSSAQNGSSSSSYEPVLGSRQHGVLWEAFMRAAKKQQKALEALQEGKTQQQPQQQQQQQNGGVACASVVNGCS